MTATTACGVDPKFPPLEEYAQSSYIPTNGCYNAGSHFTNENHRYVDTNSASQFHQEYEKYRVNFNECDQSRTGNLPPNFSSFTAALAGEGTVDSWGDYPNNTERDNGWTNIGTSSPCLYKQRGSTKLNSNSQMPAQQLPLYPWMKRIHVNPGNISLKTHFSKRPMNDYFFNPYSLSYKSFESVDYIKQSYKCQLVTMNSNFKSRCCFFEFKILRKHILVTNNINIM